MERGIPIAMQAAGVLLACLVTSLNHHPDHSLRTVVPLYDTANYYNEQGIQIWCDAKAARPGNFVIRTCRTSTEIYRDIVKRDSTASGYNEPANVQSISDSISEKVETLIRKGMIHDPLVCENVVEILDKKTIRKMYDTIRDSGKNSRRRRDFREYGGIVKADSTLTCKKGNRANPCIPDDSPEIKGIDTGGIADYHSHPSGEEESINNQGDSIICSFAQGPSRQDQKEVGTNRMGYVFGMRKGYHLVYVYDKKGVVATLPFDFLLCNAVIK